MGIQHIEDLKPQELLDFLKSWNLDNSKFQVSEKVDGSPMAFGLDETGRFYFRSKNTKFYSEKDIPDIFFMKNFSKYFRLLKDVPLAEITQKLSKRYGFSFKQAIEITGEGVPSYDHNIVIYDEEKIGLGIFVIFLTVVDGQEIRNANFWAAMAKEINDYSSIQFFAVPQIDLSQLNFDNSLIVSLSDLIEKHGNILGSPARTPEIKQLKSQLLDSIKKIGMSAKQQALLTKVNPNFGEEYEGLVIAGPGGRLVKIVDKEGFTKKGKDNYFFIKLAMKALANFKRAIKSNPEDLQIALKTWEEDLARVEEDFSKRQDEYITIPKKAEDTENEIQWQEAMIEQVKKLLAKNVDPKEISEKFLSKKMASEGRIITEGGGIFDEVNSAVPKKLLPTNIQAALKNAGLDNLSFEPVGNINKTYLGDIDVGVSFEDLSEKIGSAAKETFWKDLEAFLKKQNVKFKILSGLSQFHVLSSLVNTNGQKLASISKNGEVGKEPGIIQIDFFVGNVGWMKDTSSGAPEESKYKAKYRNLLLNAMFAKITWQGKKDPLVFNKLEMARDGFKLVQKRKSPADGKAKKISEHVFSVDADTVAHVLFDRGTKWSDMDSYEKLDALFMGDGFRFKSLRDEISKEFLTTLAKNKLEAPR